MFPFFIKVNLNTGALNLKRQFARHPYTIRMSVL